MFTQLSVSMGSVSMRLTNQGLKTVEKNCIHSKHAHFPPVAVPAVQCIKYCTWVEVAHTGEDAHVFAYMPFHFICWSWASEEVEVGGRSWNQHIVATEGGFYSLQGNCVVYDLIIYIYSFCYLL